MSAPSIPAPTPFDPLAAWPEPDMTLLNPVRPPAPVLTDAEHAWIFGPWSDWLRVAAAAKGAPVDYVSLAFLTTTSALIGNARWAVPLPDWKEPPILWGMLVGDPSAGKSPALDAVMAPLQEIEQGLAEAYKSARFEWEGKNEIARMVAADWKERSKKALKDGAKIEDKPANADAGAPPLQERLSVSDTTTEKLAELLSQTARGLLMYRDELSGWLGGMDRYSNGGDRPFWIEAYGGRPFTVDRKSNPEPIIVERLSVAVIGGTQPDRLNTLLVKADDDGMLARFLVVFPDPVPIAHPTAVIDSAVLRTAFERLWGLPPGIDGDGHDCPVVIPFDAAAQAKLMEFRVVCRQWEGDAQGSYKSHLGKLPGLVVRVSCVLVHLDWAANPSAPAPGKIDAGVVSRAIRLVGEHYRLHAYRAYGALQDPPEVRSARRLARLLADETPARVSVREIQRRKLSDLGSAREIRAALGVLVQADWVRPDVEPTNGRPREIFGVNPRIATAQRAPGNPTSNAFDTGTEGDKTAPAALAAPSVPVSSVGGTLPPHPPSPSTQQKGKKP